MSVINMQATGTRIYQLREKAGLSVKELAKMTGVGTPQAVYKWQSGMHLPTIDTLVCLAEIFGVRIDDIIVTDQIPQIAAA